MRHTDATRAFIADCAAALGLAPPPLEDVQLSTFGDSEVMGRALNELVLTGPKRATTALLRDYRDEPAPFVGAWVCSLWPDGSPALIWRVCRVDVVPFGAVDAAFAWDEGEGDRSLEDWRRGHRAYSGDRRD
jgi:uncharacterized protein YhfF